MNGLELRHAGEQSSRAFASKAPKAFQRPDLSDIMGGPVGLPSGLAEDLPQMHVSRAPEHTYQHDVLPSNRPGHLAIARLKPELEREMRDSVSVRDPLHPAPRESSGNLSMNASVQLPGLNHAHSGSLRSSSDCRPSKTEGGTRKTVLWALDDGKPRAATAAAAKFDGDSRMSSDGRAPDESGNAPPRQTGLDDDLQTQLNLLRERSWSEQQSLRRQLDDQRAEKEELKKKLDGANVRIQELQNESASIKDMFDMSAAIEKTGSASALIEEKNAQIRQLENLARQLASGGGRGLSLQAPSHELASGGGTMASLGMSVLTGGGQASDKEQRLEQELNVLRAQRDKEQEDLKELEQVVVVFETKMEALKKENKDLKRQTSDLKSMYAQSMSVQIQSSAYHSSSSKTDGIIENMSILMCSLHDRNMAMGSLVASFCRWKGSAASARSQKDENSASEANQRTGLEFQLRKAEQKIEGLKEDMESLMTRHTNLLESEQSQSAMMAQRMLKSEDSATEKDKQLAKVTADVERLERELESSQRRLASTSAMLSTGEHSEAQGQADLLHTLQDDVASLRLVRTNLKNRIAAIQNVGAAKAVRDKDRSCLLHKFQVWRMLPFFDRHVGAMVFQSNRARSKVLKMKAFQQWFEWACMMTKSDLKAVESGTQEQMEVVKSKLAAEREAFSSLSLSHKEMSARCKQLSDEVTILKSQQKSLLQDLDSGIAGRRQFDKLQPSIRSLIDGATKAKDEIDMLYTMFQCAVSENQGLRESMARLSAERDTWFEERARIQCRQTSDNGPRSAADANATLLRDRCRIVTSRLDAAELEISALRESMQDAAMLRDDLEQVVNQIQTKGLIFKKGALLASAYGGECHANPVARARHLAEQIQKCFNDIVHDFTQRAGQPESEAGWLHDRVHDLMTRLSSATNEVQTCRQEAKQQMDAKQQEVATLSSSLTLTKNEVKYLQEIADGGNVSDVYARSIKSIETCVSNLNRKYSKKVADCQAVERQLTTLTRSNIEMSKSLDAAKSQIDCLRSGDVNAVDTRRRPSEQELQAQLQDRDRDLEITKEKMQHLVDSSTALTSEVHEITALWRDSATEVFRLNESVSKLDAELRGMQELSKTLKEQLKSLQEENIALAVKADGAGRQFEVMKEESMSSKGKAAELAKRVIDAEQKSALLESQVQQLQDQLQTLNGEHAAELTANGKVEKDLLLCKATLEHETIQLRTQIAAEDEGCKAMCAGLRSLCAGMQEGMQTLSTCILEHERGQTELEQKVKGASLSNETLTKRLQECESALQSAQSEIDRLVEDLTTMRSETDKLQDQLHEQSGQNISLSRETRKLTSVKEDLEGEVKRLSDMSESHRNEVLELKQRLQAAESRHEEETDVLNAKIKTLVWDSASSQKELTEEKMRVAEAQRAINQLEEDLSGARSALEVVNTSQTQISQQLEQLRQENQQQQVELEARASGSKESEKQQAAALAARVEELGRCKHENQVQGIKIAGLEAELSDAQQKLAGTEAERAELQGGLESQSNQTHAWLAKAQELEHALASREADLARFQDAADKAEVLRREAERSLQAAQSTGEDNLKSLQSELVKDRHDKAKLESEKIYLQERVQKLKSQLEVLQEDVREREDMIEEIQQDSFMLQVQLHERLSSIKDRDTTVSCMESRLFALRNDCSLSREESEKKQKLLDAIHAELDAQTKQFITSDAKCADLEGKVENMSLKHSHELAEMDKAIDTTRRDGELLKEKVEELQGQLRDGQLRESDLQALVEHERAGIVSLKESLVEQSTLNAQLEDKISAVEQTKESTDKELQMYASKLSEAGRVMEALHAEKERFRLKTMELQRELDASQSNLAEKESDYVELEGRVEQLVEELKAGKEELSELERRCLAKTEEIEGFQCRLTQVVAELGGANQKIERQKILHSKQMEEAECIQQALQDQAALVTEAEEKVESLKEELRIKEVAAQDLVSALEQQMSDISAQLAEREGEYLEGKSRLAQLKMQYDAMATRCSEVEDENARTTSKLGEYDNLLQTKGRDLAKVHGSLAEARSLAEDAELRVQSMKIMEDKLKREIASKDKQLRSLQQNLLDGSVITSDGNTGGEEGQEGRSRIVALEKEHTALQERFQAVQETCTSLRGAEDEAKRQAADLQERLQSTELQVVSLKLEAESKQAELDTLCGKVSRLEHDLANRGDADDQRSKATTARVTPTRGSEGSALGTCTATASAPSVDETVGYKCCDAQDRLASAQQELDAVRGQLEACESKLKEKAQMDWARLSVRCHKSLVRREEEHERQLDLENQVGCAKEAAGQEIRQLQEQLVDKASALMACEKKFAQLLAWVQKNKAALNG